MLSRAISAANNKAREHQLISVKPYAGSMGAEIFDVDLRDPGDEAIAEIRQAILDHLVVFIPGQSLEIEDLEAFTQKLGPFGDDPYLFNVEDHPNVVRLLKEADEASPVIFAQAWHTDWSFADAPPSFTCLYGKDIPEFGGDTLYANMYLAYETLSDVMKNMLDGLQAIHSAARGYGPDAEILNTVLENMTIKTSETALAKRTHPLVRTHPETGRKSLFINPSYVVGIEGMHPDESNALLSYLYEHATHPAFTCRFRWSAGTLAIWDNRCTMHQPIADYHGLRREMYRTTVAGTPPE